VTLDEQVEPTREVIRQPFARLLRQLLHRLNLPLCVAELVKRRPVRGPFGVDGRHQPLLVAVHVACAGSPSPYRRPVLSHLLDESLEPVDLALAAVHALAERLCILEFVLEDNLVLLDRGAAVVVSLEVLERAGPVGDERGDLTGRRWERDVGYSRRWLWRGRLDEPIVLGD